MELNNCKQFWLLALVLLAATATNADAQSGTRRLRHSLLDVTESEFGSRGLKYEKEAKSMKADKAMKEAKSVKGSKTEKSGKYIKSGVSFKYTKEAKSEKGAKLAKDDKSANLRQVFFGSPDEDDAISMVTMSMSL